MKHITNMVFLLFFLMQFLNLPASRFEKNTPTANKTGHTIRIIHISDVQIGFTASRALELSPDKTILIPDSLKTMDAEYFRRAVALINNLAPKPDIVINTGDLVNDPMNPEQWNTYKKIASELKMPLVEVMGNHDGWSQIGIEDFRKRFGSHDYFSYQSGKCLVIVLNSFYLKNPGSNRVESEKQKQFLIQTLKKNKLSVKVIAFHFPLYQKNADEPEGYFNIPLTERKWLLEVAEKYKVRLLLSGHNHNNNVINHTHSLSLITTGSIGAPLGNNTDGTISQRGFRIIDINTSTGEFTQKFISLEQAPNESVSENNCSRHNLSFAFMGDIHFDKIEHHDLNWVIREHPGDTIQIRQYSERTQMFLPVLCNEIGGFLNGADNISMVVQSGDFTEGLCGNYSLATRQMTDFHAFIDKKIPVPFLVSKGNHDITGPDADSAYKMQMLPFLSRETGEIVANANYSIVRNQAAFIFYDCFSHNSLEWLEHKFDQLNKYPVKFVIMHEPVVPFNARSKWTELSGPSEKEQKHKLIELLGRHKVIVLCGHLHRYGLIARRTENGKFIQLAMSSVLDSITQVPAEFIEGKENYGPQLLGLEPLFSPRDRNEREEVLLKEKPFIDYFEYANLQGYAILKLSDNQVLADLYSGTGRKKWRSVNLTQLLE